MAKLSNKSSIGTSFHHTTIRTTLSELRQVLGNPQIEGNDGEDKTNIDYVCENNLGDVFTIYDWKEYRPISENEVIEFHIGGKNKIITEQSKEELIKQINRL